MTWSNERQAVLGFADVLVDQQLQDQAGKGDEGRKRGRRELTKINCLRPLYRFIGLEPLQDQSPLLSALTMVLPQPLA